MSARVLQINVSPGGVPKTAVSHAAVTRLGLVGDAVNYPKVHGGPERAICLFPLELIQELQAEGHPIFPGAVGENITTAGLDWSALEIDCVLAIGADVRLELSSRVEPCSTIADSFVGGAFKRIKPDRVPGETRWYARVLDEGTIRPGDAISIEEAG